MRIAIVYDCLFPHTVGGAERWYRRLAETLAHHHEVTYVTRRQWGRNERIDAPEGVAVVAVSGGRDLYTRSGRRKILIPIRFGLGLFWHLIRNRGAYDIVHTCAFPYFSVLAARAACVRSDTRVVVDWFEVWTRDYWREYLGPAGSIGHRLQRLCIRLTRQAFVFSNLHRARLLREGLRKPPVVLPGLYWGRQEGSLEKGKSDPGRRKVLFAGRMIPEKRATAIPPAVRLAHERDPRISATILGDGPDRDAVIQMVSRKGMSAYVEVPGFVEAARVEREMQEASMVLLPSRREGYGAVVIEAASFGTPSIVVAHPDNSAVELIEPGENGIVASSDSAEDLAAAILEIATDTDRWEASTLRWFHRHAAQIGVDASIEMVEATYRRLIEEEKWRPSADNQQVSAANE